MAVCDARYRFMLFDIGAFGSDSDGGILLRSVFGKALYGDTLNLPKETARLPENAKETPCYFVGDEVFQMSINVMRPYSGRALNDKKEFLTIDCHARRTIENIFGILAVRWRIFRRPICAGPEVVDKFVLATMCLHNFIKNDETAPQQQRYCPPQFADREIDRQIIEGEWRELPGNDHLRPIEKCGVHRTTREAYSMRDTLSSYFMTAAGKVPWQYEYIHQGLHRDAS